MPDLTLKIEELKSNGTLFYDIAEHFSGRPHFALLDSRINENHLGRYSFLTFDPFLVFRSKSNTLLVEQGDSRKKITGNPFEYLDQLLQEYRIPSKIPGKEIPPFVGGAVGYFSYELGRQVEKLPSNAKDDFDIPECYICFYNFVISYDREDDKIFLSSISNLGNTDISQLKRELKSIPVNLYHKTEIAPSREKPDLQREFKGVFTQSEYLNRINRIKEYILAGDVYQVNLTQRFQIPLRGTDPWYLYKQLMEVNPLAFCLLLEF